MKTNAGLFLLVASVCAVGSVRAQDDGSIDLSGATSETLSVNAGSLTLTDGATQLTAGTLTLNSDASLALGATNDGVLILKAPTTDGGVIFDGASTILAQQNGLSGALTISNVISNPLNFVSIQNNFTGVGTAIVTGGTVTLGPTVPLTIASGNLTLNGSAIVLAGSSPLVRQLIFPYPSTLLITPNNTTVFPAITGASLQAFVNAGVEFNLMPALTNFGGLNTTVRLLDGTASVNRTVLTTFSAGPTGAASDDVNVSGTITDTYVLELTYSQAAALAAPGGAEALRLEWLNPTTGIWENAVDGNTGGTPTFVDGAYNPATDFQLGTYGVDTTNQTVWAVIDHNSDFTAQVLPEPSGWALLSCCFGSLLALGRRCGVNRKAA